MERVLGYYVSVKIDDKKLEMYQSSLEDAFELAHKVFESADECDNPKYEVTIRREEDDVHDYV